MLYLSLLKESLIFALNALKNNKLRTLLSLLGVTVGIFSIIAVLAAVDSMDKSIRSELSNLDGNMLFVSQRSFGPTEVPSWKVEQFPEITFDEYEMLKRSGDGIDKISFNYFMGQQNIRHEENTAQSISITPCSADYVFIENVNIAEGRFFNEAEDASGSPVIIIGHEVKNTLFNEQNAIGETVRLLGKKFTVIGVIEKQGASPFGQSKDGMAYISSNFIRNNYGHNNRYFLAAITIKPEKDYDQQLFKDNISQRLRTYRGMKPDEMDNFFLNEFSGLTGFVDSIISSLNMVGWIISGFSLLVGGFGIANIMFVSVKERTNIIGIQKSLGAKNHFILYQFLFEAVILSIIGGLVGIFMVWLIAASVSAMVDFDFVLSFANILIGISLAGFIGLLSGILPAISASKLDPVEAIRTGI